MAKIDQLRKTKLAPNISTEAVDTEIFTCVNTLQVDEPIVEKIYIVVQVNAENNSCTVLSIHKKGINAEEAVKRMTEKSKLDHIHFNILEHEISD